MPPANLMPTIEVGDDARNRPSYSVSKSFPAASAPKGGWKIPTHAVRFLGRITSGINCLTICVPNLFTVTTFCLNVVVRNSVTGAKLGGREFSNIIFLHTHLAVYHLLRSIGHSQHGVLYSVAKSVNSSQLLPLHRFCCCVKMTQASCYRWSCGTTYESPTLSLQASLSPSKPTLEQAYPR